ncbi:MAG TPA: AAA family ATPase [Gaiellaceae bacterium]|nr:AAA family ATPase [Gaiellaceae bacterium]
MSSITPAAPFVHTLLLGSGDGDYSADLPALRGVERLELDPKVTFLVGENGSGKSTLIEAIAIAAKLNAEGGGKLLRFTTRASHSRLHERLSLERSHLPPLNAFFLRAESVFNMATAIEEGGPLGARENVYQRPLHEQSHGESFLDIAVNRLGPRGFYLFDEPEAALSVGGQLALMRRIHELVLEHSQFVVATHSPILLGYPDATILELGDNGIRRVDYDQTQQVELTRAFLDDPQSFLRHLLADD